uniref:NADH dehydrogenase subunit 3 n=1 Tax=Carpophilus dimidiatus TaxID=913117 RepID=UPI0013E93387|nr:NADH dehydrogenase subunit 3 [Carpophilus dimidiatus]QHR79661.1 NADH dehydrogenase subunit 3 [Carpophilus dimidiatus]
MKIMLFMFTMISLIGTIMIIVLNLVSKKTFSDREKNSPFECGFDPKNSARLPFSLHFFLIAIIFLIFDVEITLLLPLIMTLKLTSMINFSTISISFIAILLIGLYHEWNQGALNWSS